MDTGQTKGITKLYNVPGVNVRKEISFFLKLDIDDYFDTINHDYLAALVRRIIPDTEVTRLIMLAIQMGVVSQNLKWQDTLAGVPQGAILFLCSLTCI